MALKQTIEIIDLLDSAQVTGDDVVAFFQGRGASLIECKKVWGSTSSTDFVRITIPGSTGKVSQGKSSTLGIIGRLGGIGARPNKIGLVSDADGAIAAYSTALKLLDMQRKGDVLPGDVIVASHICPNAPVIPHSPVEFMGSPVDMMSKNLHEVDPAMDAILSVDTTKGNRVINHKGIAISPTIKSGCILRISDALVDILQICSGRPAQTFAVTMPDITPYGNGLYHINSIFQPSVATEAPVVGVAITTESVVPGSSTGASHEMDIATAVNFCIETAKAFGKGTCKFYDEKEYEQFVRLYGEMRVLQGSEIQSK